jgi:transcriptional regulator with XRE-family HTH domain
MSFRISITPSRRAAGRFIATVRRELQKALAEEEARGADAIKQADIARAIGVNRSVINRELRGHADISVGRIGELAWALGRRPRFDLEKIVAEPGQNVPLAEAGAMQFKTTSEVASKKAELRPLEQVG